MRHRRATAAAGSDPTDGGLFAYGTLLLAAVIEALIGRVPPRVPATLPGYRRYRVIGEVFPAIAAEPAARVDGLVYRGLGQAEWEILDAFESSIYTRVRVEVRTAPGTAMAADAYVIADDQAGLLQRAPAWSPEEFAAGSGPYVRMCEEFRTRLPIHRPDS